MCIGALGCSNATFGHHQRFRAIGRLLGLPGSVVRATSRATIVNPPQPARGDPVRLQPVESSEIEWPYP